MLLQDAVEFREIGRKEEVVGLRRYISQLVFIHIVRHADREYLAETGN